MTSRSPTGSTPRKWLDVAGSVLTALLVFAAIPAVLVLIVGNPLAGGLGHQWSHLARITLAALAVVAWVAWVACAVQLLRTVVRYVHGGDAGIPMGGSLTERIAARIAVGVLALMSFGGPWALTSTAGGAVVASPTTAQVVRDAVIAAPPMAPTTAPAPEYQVHAGDSLWSIADAKLGDGSDWPAIAALNLGRTMADGRRFVDPDLIYAGWVLELPASVGPSVATADVAVPVAAPPPAVNPTAPDIGVVAPPVPATTTLPPPFVPSGEAAVHPTSGLQHTTSHHNRSSSLPELVLLGLGSLGCAALVRRSRRLRLLRRTMPYDPDDPFVVSEDAIDAEVLLNRFGDVPVLLAFEAANCLLGRRLNAQGHPPNDPIMRAVCVGATGVTFWLATPDHVAPPDFAAAADGLSWLVAHDVLDGQELFCPHLPIVLPVGDDSDGTWLVPLHQGQVLPLVGAAAGELWQAARPVQESWSWSDMVMVTEDPSAAEREYHRMHRGKGPSEGALPILFYGDLDALPAEVAATLAVVTDQAVRASDVTVLVDHQAATIHPLGRTVRPHLLSDETARLIEELVRPLAPGESPLDESDSPLVVTAAPRGEVEEGTDQYSDAAVQGPGLVEVKLLTVTPRLEGLPDELAPNRARRAIELVAYLALHRPDTVTSDRLRTRVLGSADADAAAKTLFNTATAARRAMGVDAQGDLLFPPGSRTGHYSVTDKVTVDVQRASALARVGSACPDSELAMAYLRAALDLIESEPMANALSGYTWWEAEGHAARIAAVMVNAASNLAALAVEAGLFDLAQWGLGQARLLDPYSEALSRAAMQVAAAEGDADRLRREWRECQRRIDELDPGSSPSPRTERLYGELAKTVLVGSGALEE